MKRIFKYLFALLVFTLFLGKCYAFELDIKDSTGWAAINMPVRVSPNSYSNVITNIQAGQSFLILGEYDNYFEIEYNGQTGYIDSNYCMINLPDVIPSIKYNISNADASIYKSSGYSIDGVTGQKLYTAGKVMNDKIGREEYIVPSLYSTAKMISSAQELALKDGYSLMIYDSYRPRSVSSYISNKLGVLYSNNYTVRDNINYSYGLSGTKYYWGATWFLASGLSTHNVGAAIDVTLYDLNSNNEVQMPTDMHELSSASIKYYSTYAPKNPAGYSKGMLNNYYAKLLDNYMTSVGMGTLASEWWHFQDNAGYNRVASATSWYGCDFQVTDIVSKGNIDVNNLFTTNYDVNYDNSYIYTVTDIDTNVILSNIKLNDIKGLEASILNNQYVVKYNGSIIKTFDIINVTSTKYDYSKPYIIDFDSILHVYVNYLGQYTKCLNCRIDYNYNENKIYVKTNSGEIIREYDYVNVTGNHDFKGTTLKDEDGALGIYVDYLVRKIEPTNCTLDFDLYNNKVYIYYGDEIIKEYDVIK